MKTLFFYILAILPFLMFSQNGIQDSTVAFPGAMGGAHDATGGRNGVLYIVDNLGVSLSDDVYHPINCNEAGHSHNLPLGNADEFYTGGFFSGIENPDVGYIVYNVSGPIDLPHGTGSAGGTTIMGFGYDGIGASNKTIFGQSAPLGGITFTGGILRFGGYNNPGHGDNLIIRYIKSRPIYDKTGTKTLTDDASTWALNIFGGDNVMVDHVSLSWAQDKAGGSWINETHVTNGCTMIGQTWSHSIFADSSTGAYTEINPGRAGNPEEYVDQISYLSNLILGVNRTPNLAFDGDAEKYNNVIYNIPFKYSRAYHDIRLNERGNYYLEYGNTYEFNWAGPLEGSDIPIIHASGNYLNGTISRDEYSETVNFDGTLSQDNRELWTSMSSSPDVILELSYYTTTPHDFSSWSNTVLTTPQVAFADIITDGNVGANKYLDDDGYVQIYHDEVDLAMINAVRNRTNWVSDTSRWTVPTTSNTRPASYDTDFDGMADAWELRVYGDLSQSYRGDYDGDGRTNIEEFNEQVDLGNSTTPSDNYSVTPNSGLTTTEDGGTDSFYVVLTTQPTTDVVFNITSSALTEGTVDKSTLTFTSDNWNNNQLVTVTGVDDVLDDGNIAYSVKVSIDDALSDDAYDALPDTNVSVTNIDNDISSDPGSGNSRMIKSGFTTIHN